MKRRAYLATIAAAAVAGCIGEGDDWDPNVASPPEISGDTASDSSARTETPAEPRSVEPGAFDTFETLEGWNSVGTVPVLDAEGPGGTGGTVRLDAGTEEGTVGIVAELSRPIDVSAVLPGLRVAVSDVCMPYLQLFDANGNQLDFRQRIPGDVPVQPYNLGVHDGGDFDPADVREIRITVWTAEGQERTVWLDDLHFVPRPETGKVLIQFDDGFETDYTEAFRLLDEYGYPAVSFVNPAVVERGAVDGPERLSMEQLEALQDAGWNVANHANRHARLTDLSREQLDEEVRAGQQWLLDHGFLTGSRYFSYPFGAVDAAAIEVVAEHHDLAFWSGGGVTGYAVNPAVVPRLNEPTAERARVALDRTAEMRGITTLRYRRLNDERLAAFEAAVSRLHEHEASGDLEVVLPRELDLNYTV